MRIKVGQHLDSFTKRVDAELVFTAIPNEMWFTSHSLGLQYSSYYITFNKLSLAILKQSRQACVFEY